MASLLDIDGISAFYERQKVEELQAKYSALLVETAEMKKILEFLANGQNTKVKSKDDTKEEHMDCYINEQLLIFQYLGADKKLGDTIHNHSKYAELLHPCLNRSKQRIRQQLRKLKDLHDSKIPADRRIYRKALEKTASVFEKAGAKQILKKINLDIKKYAQ